jgi:hypothetical protein
LIAEHTEQLAKAKVDAEVASKELDEAKLKLGQREKMLKQS